MDDDIARAHLRRVAADTRSAVAVAALGSTVRHWKGHVQGTRQVTSLGGRLGVSRKFLYRVFAGTEWHPR